MNLEINGQMYQVDVPNDEPLLWVLRDILGLTGTKFGCGIGVCGACTVLVAGEATRACITPAVNVADRPITTIEGMATQDATGTEILHPIQQAFLDEQVPQCGWCMSGQMMTAAAFLARTQHPSAADIDSAMAANYCRCGSYVRIKAGVARAAIIQQERDQ